MEALGTGGVYPAPCGGDCYPLSPTPVPQTGFTTAEHGVSSSPASRRNMTGLSCSGLALLICQQDKGLLKRTDLTLWRRGRLSNILGASPQWAQGPLSAELMPLTWWAPCYHPPCLPSFSLTCFLSFGNGISSSPGWP